MKPAAVIDYNANMQLVDKSDMQIGIVETVRKSIKWYRKLFFHFVDIALLNAYNMYLMKTGNKPHLKNFRLAVIRQLIAKYANHTPVRRGGRRAPEQSPMRVGECISLTPCQQRKKKSKPSVRVMYASIHQDVLPSVKTPAIGVLIARFHCA